MNKVLLVGRLGADPEVTRTESGAIRLKVSVATINNYKLKNGERAPSDWHTVIMWGKLAELGERFLYKGGEISVEGKLKTFSGEKGKFTYVEASEFRALGPKPPQEYKHTEADAPPIPGVGEGVGDLPF